MCTRLRQSTAGMTQPPSPDYCRGIALRTRRARAPTPAFLSQPLRNATTIRYSKVDLRPETYGFPVTKRYFSTQGVDALSRSPRTVAAVANGIEKAQLLVSILRVRLRDKGGSPQLGSSWPPRSRTDCCGLYFSYVHVVVALEQLGPKCRAVLHYLKRAWEVDRRWLGKRYG